MARPYTEEEKNFVRENAAEMTVKRMAKMLNRSDASVRKYCKRNGIQCKKCWESMPRTRNNPVEWTDEEIDFVWDHAHEMTMAEMGRAIGKNTMAVLYLGKN